VKSQNRKVIWLAWQKHRRTQSICEYLDIPMYAETVSASRVVRYIKLTIRSLKIIHVESPRILIVQNPSIVLCFLTIILRPFYRYRLVVDAHNEGVLPYANKSKVFLLLTDFIVRNADYTIVTNRFLANLVKKKQGNPLVLPDRLPSLRQKACMTNFANSTKKIFLLICTHAKDEPVQQILDAVAHFTDEILLVVTGKAAPEILGQYENIPDNVSFSGFLPDDEYLAALAGCDCVIDLTMMEYCLVCGAYEAVSVGKPMILSEDLACREIFSKGTIYTKPDTRAIIAALNEALLKLEYLAAEARELKDELEVVWKIYAEKVINEIGLDNL